MRDSQSSQPDEWLFFHQRNLFSKRQDVFIPIALRVEPGKRDLERRATHLNLEAHFSPGSGAVQQSRSELQAFAIMIRREIRHERFAIKPTR